MFKTKRLATPKLFVHCKSQTKIKIQKQKITGLCNNYLMLYNLKQKCVEDFK